MSKRLWTPVILVLAALLLRLPFLAQGPGGWDDVDFALGVGSFDLARMQPHFPGYPIYMVAAFVAAIFYKNSFLALSGLSAVAMALSVWPLYAIVSRLGGQRIAFWTALAWSVSPLGLVLGTQPLSDAFGLLIALLLVECCLRSCDPSLGTRARAIALLGSGIWLGLLLGVRVSYVALAAVPLWAAYVYGRDTRAYRDIVASVASCLLVCLLWGYALAVNVGSFAGLWKLGTSFTSGHFSDWGGTFTEGSSLWERLVYWIGRQWFAAGIGTPWKGQLDAAAWIVLALTLLGLGALAFRVRSWHWRNTGFLIAWVLPYLLWALFAQNVEKPRHVLPLLPVLIGAIIAGLLTWKRTILPAVLVVAMLTVGAGQVMHQAEQPSPMAELASFLQQHPASLVYTYEEERVIRYYLPNLHTERLRQWEDFRSSLLSEPVWSEPIYLTGAVLDGFHKPELRSLVQEAARFQGSPWLYPTYHDIVLYEIPPAQFATWKNMLQSDAN
ncbi:MAG: glycosyltransferase family 39 protein [Tumebacillaceae bacterium]